VVVWSFEHPERAKTRTSQIAMKLLACSEVAAKILNFDCVGINRLSTEKFRV